MDTTKLAFGVCHAGIQHFQPSFKQIFSATLQQPTNVGAGLAATTHRMRAVCAMMMMANALKCLGQNHGQRGSFLGLMHRMS